MLIAEKEKGKETFYPARWHDVLISRPDQIQLRVCADMGNDM